MNDLFHKLRYKLLGKQIQRSLELAEDAGREGSKYEITILTKELEHANYNFTMLQDKIEREADVQANKKLATLNYAVNPDDVITVNKTQAGVTKMIFLGKESLTEQEISNFKAEAALIKQTRLWKVITETLKSQAHDIMFTKSETYDDMRAGKMMLYSLGVIETITKTIESYEFK